MSSKFFSDNNEKTLVIRASAGTGKTYRLSLEFINLLLKYRISFDEILVITFTKKATAEIRERIFLQLKDIVNNTAVGIELKQNIRKNINSEIQFNKEEMNFLQTVYQNMITNKSAVKISTIDSFVNTVFSGIIAPFHNITEFSIDNKNNNEILPEIYESILQDENLDKYKNIFLQAKRRNLDQFKKLILEIIENRWLFEFIDLSDLNEQDIESEKEQAYRKYKTNLQKFLDLLQNEIFNKVKPTPLENYFQKDFKESFLSSIDFATLETSNIAESLYDVFKDYELLSNNYKLIFDKKKKLYHSGKLKNEELKILYSELQSNLADFLYFDKALTEQFNIISLAADVLHIYDEIKFRDKIFTYSDISYYTFRFLYDPQLSIVDKGNVLNVFYEQLSYNT
ncbi:MAG: UvrD-helicase domain-containing protein, partial [Candidatus Tenebribacter burtonii]|nr:UvrD-helicase domain-containing protein [Candidatus Tenebribacter burtonii]